MKPQDLQTLARRRPDAPGFATTTAESQQQPAAVTAAAAIAAKVDRLGAMHAAMADMKRQADQIRAELEDAGLTDIEGQLYRVNFATVAGSTLTNWKQSPSA
jgi:hypothetical protein